MRGGSCPPGVTPWGKVLSAFLAATMVPFQSFPPATVDIRVTDEGLDLAPFGVSGRVVYTPGHSPGSLTVLLATGDALVGDLCMNAPGLRRGPCLPVFAEDPTRLRGSLEKVLALGARTIHPAHGLPFPASWIEAALPLLPS